MPTVPNEFVCGRQPLGAGGLALRRDQGVGAIARPPLAGLRQPLVLFDALVVCAAATRRQRRARPCWSEPSASRRADFGCLAGHPHEIRRRRGPAGHQRAGLRRCRNMRSCFRCWRLAAMGLPPFGVFAGFMGLLLTAPLSSTDRPVHRARRLAGRLVVHHADGATVALRRATAGFALCRSARHPEFASLLIVVLALLALGLAPTSLFAPEHDLRIRPAPSGISHMEPIDTFDRH